MCAFFFFFFFNNMRISLRLVETGCVCARLLSHVLFFAIPWTVAHEAPLSRQESWSGLPYPPPGDLPDLGIKLISLTSPALAGRFFTTFGWTIGNRRLQFLSSKFGYKHIIHLLIGLNLRALLQIKMWG